MPMMLIYREEAYIR